GLFVRSKTVVDRWVPVVCLAAPTLTFVISLYSKELFGAYEFAEELIILNGGLTFIGLWIISRPTQKQTRF
ncbi:MAG TPA: sodium:solute symporter, partial [Flavobacterium sp.]|nr:sodium:solute symporter [Flavobacterium sp.]